MPILLPPTRESYTLVIRRVLARVKALEEDDEDFTIGQTYYFGYYYLWRYAKWFPDPMASLIALDALFRDQVGLIYHQPEQRLKNGLS